MNTESQNTSNTVAMPETLWGKLKYFWEKKSGIVGLIELYLVGIFWGLGTIIAKIFFFAGFNELQVAFIRTFVGALGLLALILVMKRLDLLKLHRDKWLLLMNGASYALMYYAFLVAIKISVAHGTILLIAAPIFVAVLSPIFLEEELHRNTIYAVIFTIIGIAFLILSSVKFERDVSTTKMLFSDLMGITAGFFAAFYIMSGRKLKRSYEPLSVSFWSMAVASVLFAIPFLFTSPPTPKMFNAKLVFWALFMGFGINGLGTYLNMDGVRKVIAQRAVIIQMILDPLVSIILAWILFHEKHSISVFIGGIFMVIGLYIATKEEAAVHLAVEKLDIDPDAKKILLAIKQLGSASIYRLAEETGLPEDVVSEKIKFLLEQGYLVKREEGILRYWEKILEEEKALIDKVKESLDNEEFQKAVELLANARVIFVGEKSVGLNFSKILTSYFKSAGVPSIAVPAHNTEALLSVIRNMRKKDVLFITDYVFHEKTLDLMIDHARKIGAKIVIVADNFTAKAVKDRADIVLKVQTKKLGLPVSLVPIHVVIDSLVVGVAIQKRKLIQRVASQGGGK